MSDIRVCSYTESCTTLISRKPEINGRKQVWANAWDMVRRTQSRDGRGRRAAVDFVVFHVQRDFVFFPRL